MNSSIKTRLRLRISTNSSLLRRSRSLQNVGLHQASSNNSIVRPQPRTFRVSRQCQGNALTRLIYLFFWSPQAQNMRPYRGPNIVNASAIFNHINNVLYPNDTAEEGLTVGNVMEKWIRKTGYPLVTIVRYNESDHVSLYQVPKDSFFSSFFFFLFVLFSPLFFLIGKFFVGEVRPAVHEQSANCG